MRRKVTQAEFYAAMGGLDVRVRVRGSYTDADYGTDYVRQSNGQIVGQTVAVGPHPHYKPDCEFYLLDARA